MPFAAPAPPPEHNHARYDPFGNIQKNKITSTGGSTFAPCYQSSPSINNRISLVGGTGSNCTGGTAPSYDANGNSLNDTFHTFTWDAENRPVTIGSVALTYDALGRMAEQSVSGANSEVVYSPLGAKMALMNGTTLTKAFVPLTGGATAVYTSSGLAYYRHADHLGSSRFASTPTQTLYSDTAYSPFGETYASSGSIDPSFTGQNQDTTAGLYDFLYREYDPNQARWTSPDPAGLAAVNAATPQSWNRYVYVQNNPLAYVDPAGLDACLLFDNAGDPIVIDTSEGDCDAQGGIYSAGVAGPPTIQVDAGEPFLPPDSSGDDGSGDGGFGPLGAGNSGGASGSPGCPSHPGPSKIYSANFTTNVFTAALGSSIGGAISGPPGAAIGGLIGGMFGVGPSASYVPSSKGLYVGPTIVFAPIGGGSGFSANYVNVPSTQNPNSIANGPSSSVTFQPLPIMGATVVKSPGSGPPVVGPSIGTRVPVSFGASYNFCVHNCGGC